MCCDLLTWLIDNIDVLLLLVIGFGLVIMVYLSGHIAGQREGFINGIMHHIHIKAYDAADFPAKYEADRYVNEARQRLEKGLRPKIPADLRDDA
ncbi:hypothetical protein SAMN05660964_03175 [Thiothrix caldifontis]|jgi:hypothetical protein|uniref:Uncharacterized protein n=1 Tax=Thiothrix caldifontis TaxID=525918 RepID=A0A1H4FXN7_9GAMM|nr:hypothetical protein [Thiothrix caldifontis]SEB02085.1 hypothetical protein SAMN05660964_03175 [Thiothrix caldifontis]